MIATKDSFEPHSSEQLPNSKRVYVPGKLHAGVRVPMREIKLTPTKKSECDVIVNRPVRVYDCSGPWGDPNFTGTSEEGLPALRRDWILKRRGRFVRLTLPVNRLNLVTFGEPNRLWATLRVCRASANDP